MALLLEEISWAEPNFAAVQDAAWEAEVRRRGAPFSEIDRRVAISPWLRATCLDVATFRPQQLDLRLCNIAMVVVSQENACRYCYGANRAFMKILGYPESFIARIEREAQMAELDPRERGLVAFCRSLARSRPRPARAARDALVAVGFAPAAVDEAALFIAVGCFYNRVGILMACPPELAFERMANGWKGRLMGFAGPVMRRVMAWTAKPPAGTAPDATTLSRAPFGSILVAVAGLHGAAVLQRALEGAFASAVLPRTLKALMFAVVARSLGCPHSEAAARAILADEGRLTPAEVDAALTQLASPRLAEGHGQLLSWVRGTVHYQTGPIQRETQALVQALGAPTMLEAIGIAALANGVVRLAMLLE